MWNGPENLAEWLISGAVLLIVCAVVAVLVVVINIRAQLFAYFGIIG